MYYERLIYHFTRRIKCGEETRQNKRGVLASGECKLWLDTCKMYDK